jgi:serine/threonine-protein kinase 11
MVAPPEPHFSTIDSDDPIPFKKINNYVIHARIAQSSRSIVFLATDSRTGDRYAIKQLQLSDLACSGSAIEVLEREIRVMRRLRHPNIVRLFEVLRVPGTDMIFLVLDYADGGSVQGYIERSQKLPLGTILSVVKQIALALRFIHGSGHIHQNIRPSKILVRWDGRAFLSDLGVGDGFLTAEPSMESLSYQAPEALDESCVCDSVPQKEDVWALGVTLYQLIFLKLPFVGSDCEEILREIQGKTLDFEGTDSTVVELLKGMLAVRQNDRFGIEDVLAHPSIRGALDRAPELPRRLTIELKEGDMSAVTAELCPPGFSFAGLAMPHRWKAGSRRRNTDAPMSPPPITIPPALLRASEADLNVVRYRLDSLS